MFAETLQAMHTAELGNSRSRTLYSHQDDSLAELNTPAMTKNTTYDIKKDQLLVTKSICVISSIPLIKTFENLLKALHDLCTKEPEVVLEGYVYNLLYEVPMPPPGRSLKFSTGGRNIICQRPGLSELPLCDYSLREMFSLFSVDNILNILSSVLLEHQILLYSVEYRKLMLVAEGISCLIFPFQWQHVYVPILPASLLHFLDAPVPFVMGLHHSQEGKSLLDICSQANMCFIDIDKGHVELPEDLPLYPYYSELKGDLTQELLRLTCATQSDFANGHQRDSGFIRESFIGPDDLSASGEASASSSTWSISKLEMLQQNETVAKITALAKKTGVISSLEDISSSLVDPMRSGNGRPHQLDAHTKDLIFNSAIREIFLHYFLQIFSAFEAFVIPPSQDMDAWLSNREIMQNFDKAAFLSDHPEAHLPFLSAFIETQMFTSFIDNKIIAQWEEPDLNLRLFELRLKTLKEDQGDHRVRRFYRTGAAKDTETIIERRAQIVDLVAPPAKSTDWTKENLPIPGYFPILSCGALSQEPTTAAKRDSSKWKKKGRTHQHTEHLQLSSDQKEKYIQEARSKGVRYPKLSDMNPAAMVHTNWKFVETLLKECKTKTKRMLVEKMGQEAVELGHGEATITGVEENTLIASLCDLLERIWSHGLQQKQGKSALWSHLVSFQEVEQCNSGNKTVDPSHLSPALAWCILRKRFDCMFCRMYNFT